MYYGDYYKLLRLQCERAKLNFSRAFWQSRKDRMRYGGFNGAKSACFRISDEELNEYLIELQMIGWEYKKYLEYLGIDTDYESVAEVGKGDRDSIVKGTSTTVITTNPYQSRTQRIIRRDFFPADTPNLLEYNYDNTQLLETRKVPDWLTTFITQNPYSDAHLNGWHEIFNGEQYDSVVGIYGTKYDKDMKYKEKMLQDLASCITSENVRISFDNDGDNYFGVVYSEPKIKTLDCKRK